MRIKELWLPIGIILLLFGLFYYKKISHDVTYQRKTAYPILDLFVHRWSSYALSSKPINHQTLMSLFEAARWAPSSYNDQPWRFIYIHRTSPAWQTFLDLMVPFNQLWASQASVLVVVVSANNFAYNKKPSNAHSFDTGAAVENLALQAASMGLIVHAIGGFSRKKARNLLHIPDNFTVEVMLAIGYPGNKEHVSENIRKRENPSDRKPIESFVFEGSFLDK